MEYRERLKTYYEFKQWVPQILRELLTSNFLQVVETETEVTYNDNRISQFVSKRELVENSEFRKYRYVEN